MNVTYQIKPTSEKIQEIQHFLNGYWGGNIWYVYDSFFDDLRPKKCRMTNKVIKFSVSNSSVNDEIKYMFAFKLRNREIRFTSVLTYAPALNRLAEFLNTCYPKIASLTDIPYDVARFQWQAFLIGKGFHTNNKGDISNHTYSTIFNQLRSFYMNFYDIREEYEKNTWDFRKIPGAKISKDQSSYFIDFSDIATEFRGIVKRYMKDRTAIRSQSQCRIDVIALRMFANHIHTLEPSWNDLTQLTRNHMERFLSWYMDQTKGLKVQHILYLSSLRFFLNYIQRAKYPEAPKLPSACLLFQEDIPKASQGLENVNYIPENVLQQLENNLEYLTPAEYIPIVIILKASGWRISDVLNLRYDTCLCHTFQGWYLCENAIKAQDLGDCIPITDEIMAVVQAAIDEAKEQSTNDNNPNHLLFARYDGKRKGRCPQGASIQSALNRLAKKHKIVDDQGEIFHFGNHAFRHTKGIGLINNGMNILNVQKWMAHTSLKMMLRYYKCKP